MRLTREQQRAMTSPDNKQLIEKIIQQGHGKSPDECRMMLKDLFNEHNVTSSLVKEWTADDFDNIKLGESDKPIKPARKRTESNRHTDPIKPVTTYTDASQTDVNDALKRLGYPEIPGDK